MKFNFTYFVITVVIFIIEVLIATVFKDIVFVRAYLGDVLVVILIYTFLRSFINIKNREKILLGVFLFAVLIEVLQYFNIADMMGLKEGSAAQIAVGNSFSWLDVLCYAVGCIVAWWADFYYLEKK